VSPAVLATLLLVTVAPGTETSSTSVPVSVGEHTSAAASVDEADPLAAGLSPFGAWGCHGPAALGMLTGAVLLGVTFGVVGAWGTYTVNAGVADEERASLSAMSFLLSSALGVLIGGGLGAAVGLIVEVIVPDAPARRVIRVSERGGDAPANGLSRAAIAY
jgi:hypothetical protein